MFLKALAATALLALTAGAAHAAGCTAPKEPRDLPDGNKATKEQMMEAHKAVQEYNDRTTEYTDCLQRELDEAIARKGDKITDKERKALEARRAEKHDGAMDRLQKVADYFNAQARIFNARTAADGAAKSN